MQGWRLLLFSMTLLAISLQTTMGYIVTPILFSEIASQTAGDIAGVLFAIFSYFVMAVALSSLVVLKLVKTLSYLPKWPLWCIFGLTAVSHYALGGWMAQIKVQSPQGVDSQSANWELFMQIHGVYQLLYVIVLLMLLGWLWHLAKSDK